MTRAQDIATGLAATRARIDQACLRSGRDADEVTLVVVTKLFPASDVQILADLGVSEVGENRHQEAEAKAAELVSLGLRWHFIGGLQSNKASAVARYADAVHSVDRAKLIGRLAQGAQEAAREVEVLVQVSLDPPGVVGRAGADVESVAGLADQIEGTEGLVLRGLTGVAPWGEDPTEAFGRLARIAGEIRARHPEAWWISAGMSGDLEAAITAGATHVRVGAAVLGPRPTDR